MREKAGRAPSTNFAVAITRDEDNNGRHESALWPRCLFLNSFEAPSVVPTNQSQGRYLGKTGEARATRRANCTDWPSAYPESILIGLTTKVRFLLVE